MSDSRFDNLCRDETVFIWSKKWAGLVDLLTWGVIPLGFSYLFQAHHWKSRHRIFFSVLPKSSFWLCSSDDTISPENICLISLWASKTLPEFIPLTHLRIYDRGGPVTCKNLGLEKLGGDSTRWQNGLRECGRLGIRELLLLRGSPFHHLWWPWANQKPRWGLVF